MEMTLEATGGGIVFVGDGQGASMGNWVLRKTMGIMSNLDAEIWALRDVLSISSSK